LARASAAARAAARPPRAPTAAAPTAAAPTAAAPPAAEPAALFGDDGASGDNDGYGGDDDVGYADAPRHVPPGAFASLARLFAGDLAAATSAPAAAGRAAGPTTTTAAAAATAAASDPGAPSLSGAGLQRWLLGRGAARGVGGARACAAALEAAGWLRAGGPRARLMMVEVIVALPCKCLSL
jgi:hypothetical protein